MKAQGRSQTLVPERSAAGGPVSLHGRTNDAHRHAQHEEAPASAAVGLRALGVWHRHLGRPAAVALVLLTIAAALQWHWRPQFAGERERLQGRLLALPAARAATNQVAVVQAPAGLELPSQRQRASDVELLVGAAQRSGLLLERADYAMAAPNGQAAARMQATLPLTGNYAALRRYVAAVLNALPHAALESLSLERADAQSPQLQATARLVLFYRAEQP